jgi:type I restriction enzyme S subunit
MSEWREVKLGHYAKVIGGYAFKSKDFMASGDFPVIKIKNVAKGTLDMADCQFVAATVAKDASRFKAEHGDILIAMTGSHITQPSSVVGRVARYNYNAEAYVNQRVGKVVNRNAENLASDFLYYFMTWEETTYSLANIASGSANQANISASQIEGLQLILPPTINEQRAIASILSSLDDKIDLLTRQNATLEALAKTYFRQWFVEEASKNWEIRALGEFVICTTGLSYKGEYLQPSSNALVTLKNYERSGGFSDRGFKEYTGAYKEEHIIKPGDIIVAHTDLTQNGEVIGNAIIVENSTQYKTLILTMDSTKVEPMTDRITKEFLYYLLITEDFKGYCLGCSNGSTVLHLNRKAVSEYIFLLPPKEMIKTFSVLARNILDKKRVNSEQIQTLQRLRDTLLPKLISGEVRVKQERDAADG